VALSFRDEKGVVQVRKGAIADVYARGGAEYLSIANGDTSETVRLDRIVDVDGVSLADD
jgi:Rho-binding antiterminator